MQKITLLAACLFWVFVAMAQPNITRVEYFINTDSGFGKGIAIPITAAPTLNDISFTADITNAPEGINSLYIRSRDANGNWSVTNRFIFVHTQPAAINITGAEYFFDTDTGFGKGRAIALTPGADLINVAVNADISLLNEGVHYLYLRSRTSNGKWSVTNSFIFVRTAGPAAPVTGAEYFIDTDPGFGNAAPVALNPATNLPDFIMNVNITGLSVGNHRLYLRSRDTNGKWSLTNTYEFPIAAVAPTPVIAVNSITKKTLCGSNQFNLAYYATGTYNANNNFTVQLSNAAGSFASTQVIGTLSGSLSGLINCTIPLQIPNGMAYRVRVVSTSPIVTGLTSDTVFTLYTQPRFSDTLAPIICLGETTNITGLYNTTGFIATVVAPNPTQAPAGNYQLITSNTPLCKDTAIISVRQDIARWTGTVSDDWHTPGNWSTGKVPGEKTHVIISAGTPNPCKISTANARVSSIQLRNGAVLQASNNRLSEVLAKCNPLPAN